MTDDGAPLKPKYFDPRTQIEDAEEKKKTQKYDTAQKNDDQQDQFERLKNRITKSS